MNIAVTYRAQLRHAAGVPAEKIELDGPCSLRAFVAILAERHGPLLQALLLDASGSPQPTILIFVGDQQVGPGQHVELRDGDAVTMLAPMAGG